MENETMTKLMIGLMMAGALLVGCGDKAGGDKGGEKGADKGAAAAGGDSIGVKECDDYLKKMEGCIKNMPAEGKAPSEAALKQNRDAWKQMAAEPATKGALAGACKTALDAIAANPACK
ncbi:MAG TPA: hypothetical protein VGM56_13190 [Byssovorax sp.]|jgi:hypothetical protein